MRANIQDLAERTQQLYLEYQDNYGAFIGKPQASDRDLLRPPPASKSTKAHWKNINDRCKKLDGKLGSYQFEHPNAKPTDLHLTELSDLRAEISLLERLWEEIKANTEKPRAVGTTRESSSSLVGRAM